MWKAQEKTKLRLAVSHTTRIRKAVKASINAEKVVKDWLDTHPTKESVTTQSARHWAEVSIHPDKKPMEKALEKLYADSWELGNVVARAALVKVSKKALYNLAITKTSAAINWETWKPGHEAAASLLKPPVGLHKLLSSRGVAIQDINRTSTDRIGTQLAYALEQGLSPSSTVSAINDILNDPERALMIAQTEMSRAVSIASRDQYENSGVEYVEWLVAEGCDDCKENAAAGPIPIDATFPTGDSEPPAHPNCMCSLAPYVVDTQNLGEDNLDSSFAPLDDGGDQGSAVSDLAD